MATDSEFIQSSDQHHVPESSVNIFHPLLAPTRTSRFGFLTGILDPEFNVCCKVTVPSFLLLRTALHIIVRRIRPSALSDVYFFSFICIYFKHLTFLPAHSCSFFLTFAPLHDMMRQPTLLANADLVASSELSARYVHIGVNCATPLQMSPKVSPLNA